MSLERELRIGVIGLGFMGRTHIRSYRKAAAAGFVNRLVAVCDRDAARLAGEQGERGNLEEVAPEGPLFNPDEVRGYATPEELLADNEIDLVSICSPTDTHVDLAIAALRAEKHVVVEKPVALSSTEVERLVEVAASSPRLCMPAMCMRFWPGWRWLKEKTESGEYGPVRSAVFRRLGTKPGWSPGFYDDPQKSGGALIDLHVHDSDFVMWCFGKPQAVTTAGTIAHLTTAYRFADGPAHAVAEAGWDHAPGFAFRMGYTVVFERATADFDFLREPLLVLSRDGGAEPVELAAETGYDAELRHVLSGLAAGVERLDVTVEDALELARLLEAERRSLETGRPVEL